jgi:DNA-binding response OmpR family regulator
LTPREFATAWLFFTNAGVSLTRATVAKAIWGSETDCADRTIEQHVYKLRKKLTLGAENGVTLRTVYSVGYRLEVFAEESIGRMHVESSAARAPFTAHAAVAGRF